jgi:hypothetical protein
MSFILKTNSRKKLSGSRLMAKIVSKDMKASTSKTYDVIVQTQALSDKEKVLRDKQQLESALDAANNWSDITYSIAQLTTLTNTEGSNGCRISVPVFDNVEINDIKYMDNNGNVLKRLPYDSTIEGSNPGLSASMTITITSPNKKESDTLVKEFIIPRYQPMEVLYIIFNALSNNTSLSSTEENRFWDAVRNNNISPKRVFGSLKDCSNFTKANIVSLIHDYTGRTSDDGIVLSDYVNTSIDSNIPSFTVLYPAIHADENDVNLANIASKINGIIDINTGEFRVPSPSDIYVLAQNELNAIGLSKITIRDNDVSSLTEAETVELFGSDARTMESRFKNYGCIIGYGITFTSSNQNRLITGTMSLNGKTLRINNKVPLVYLSRRLVYNDVRDTISKSARISWFLTEDYFSDPDRNLNIVNALLNTDSSSNTAQQRVTITFKKSENIILRLPSNILNLSLGNNINDYITDVKNIGYYTNENGQFGFGGTSGENNMFTFNLQFDSSAGFTGFHNALGTQPLTGDVDITSSNRQMSFVSSSQQQYIFLQSSDTGLNTSEYTGSINGSFSIVMKESLLKPDDNNGNPVTIYFTIKQEST